jgi:hypothetical protein
MARAGSAAGKEDERSNARPKKKKSDSGAHAIYLANWFVEDNGVDGIIWEHVASLKIFLSECFNAEVTAVDCVQLG